MADRSTTWIEDARKAVDQASNVVQAQAEFDVLVDADEQFDDILRELTQLEQAATLGHGSWWAGIDAPPDLWTELRSARTILARRQLASVVRKLTQFRRQVRETVQTSWKNYLASQTGDASELRDLMQVLSGAEGLTEVAHSLDEALSRLARSQMRLPDAQAMKAVSEVVELLDALERRLPTVVKAFVSAAAHGGASLELLDVEVWDWLVDSGALHNFRVVPGRPQEVPRG